METSGFKKISVWEIVFYIFYSGDFKDFTIYFKNFKSVKEAM